MAIFSYTRRSKSGETQTGMLDAANEDDAAATLARDGWFLTSLTRGKVRPQGLSFSFGGPAMSPIERIVFTDHVAEMIGAGTPIVETLEAYGEEENKHSSVVVSDLVESISQGKKLSEALRRHPKIFSTYYVALVAAGELTGRLDESFKYLAKELRREYEFKEKIKSALFYPVMVLIVAFAVIALLVFLVIPKITELTKSFGGDLPLATRIVADAATFITSYGPLIFIVLIILIVLLVILFRRPSTRKQMEPFLYRIPLIGDLLRQYALARFARVIGSCLAYGIPVATAFDTVSDVVSSDLYRAISIRAKERVVKGMNIADSLGAEDKKYIPLFLTRSIKGSEKTGTLAAAFLRIATFYENEVDRNLHRITELIQPILTVILGIIVGAIALSVVAPIYQMTSKIK